MDTSKPFMKYGLIGGAIAGVLSLAMAIPLLNCLVLPVSCVSFFALPMGVGFFTAKESNVGSDYGEAAKQGALAGLVTGFISGLVSFVVNIIGTVLGIGMTTGLGALDSSMTGGDVAMMGATSVVGTILTGICGMIVAFLVNTAFATLGGVIQVAVEGGTTESVPVAPTE